MTADVLAGESIRSILDVHPILYAGPLDLEGRDGWYWIGTAAEEGVAAVMEIEQVDVVGLIHGVAGTRIDAADARRRQPQCPEQTARRDSGIEVDDLFRCP